MAEAPVPVMGTPVSATIRAEPGSPSHVYLWPVAMGEAPADALAVGLRCSRCPTVWGMSGDLGGVQFITRWGELWHRAGEALISVINLSAKLRLMAPSQPPVPGHTHNTGTGGKVDG